MSIRAFLLRGAPNSTPRKSIVQMLKLALIARWHRWHIWQHAHSLDDVFRGLIKIFWNSRSSWTYAPILYMTSAVIARPHWGFSSVHRRLQTNQLRTEVQSFLPFSLKPLLESIVCVCRSKMRFEFEFDLFLVRPSLRDFPQFILIGSFFFFFKK